MKNRQPYKSCYFFAFGLITIFQIIISFSLKITDIDSFLMFLGAFFLSYFILILSVCFSFLAFLILNRNYAVNYIKTNKDIFLKVGLSIFLIFGVIFLENKINNINKPANSVGTTKMFAKRNIVNFNKHSKKTGEWIVVGDVMSKSRQFATANLLPDGNVLLMGGICYNDIDNAEIFDPKKMKIVKTIPLDDRRFTLFSTVSLKNGDVFITGGYVNKENFMLPKKTNSSMIFDAKKYTFKKAKSMKYSIKSPKLLLLKNNNVLILRDIESVDIPESEEKHFQIYNPSTDTYTETKNITHKRFISSKIMTLDNGDILLDCCGTFPDSKDKSFSGTSIYKYKENKFEVAEDFPTERLFIQLDSENYLSIKPELHSSSGYIYNIKTKEKTPVKNKIDRTFYSASYSLPKLILLKNGDVLIVGISLKKLPPKNKPNKHKRRNYDYSTYIYNKKKNLFYKVPSPYIKIDNHAASVMLENGDILIAGGRPDEKGKKIQIYKTTYKE